MRLARLARFLVATTLASCGAGAAEPRRPVEVAAPRPPFDGAGWAALAIADVVEALLPARPDVHGMYVTTAYGWRSLHGAPDERCPLEAARCKDWHHTQDTIQRPDLAAKILVVEKTGEVRWLAWKALDAAAAERRAANPADPIVAVFDLVREKPDVFGFYFVRRGDPKPSVSASLPEWMGRAQPAAGDLIATTFATDGSVIDGRWFDGWLAAQVGKPLAEIGDADLAKLTVPQRAAVRAVGLLLRKFPEAKSHDLEITVLETGVLVWTGERDSFLQHACGAGGAMLVLASERHLEVIQEYSARDSCRLGRRPPGLVPPEREATIAGALAAASYLEAASVPAFEQLAAELAAHGAPEELVARARAAAADEVRHAHVMAGHARRAGAELDPVAIAPGTPRSAFALALDNAVEGCVHEAFAAVLARFAGERATDRALAADLAAIADDEAAHGDLAWDIARWLEPRLAAGDRAAVEHARRLALADLPRSAVTEADRLAAIAAPLGLPDRAHAGALAEGFAAHASRA
jgi:hypothetical protein